MTASQKRAIGVPPQLAGEGGNVRLGNPGWGVGQTQGGQGETNPAGEAVIDRR